jgi:hypothetical protein
MIQRATTTLIAILTAGLLLALTICVVILPRLLYPPLSDVELANMPSAKERIELQQAQGALENNARATLLQSLGGILVIVGLIATWQPLTISREGQITDRFTKAIDQLGNDKQEIRVGGIRALERIALNSRKDRATIAYVLGAFIRVHAPWAATETVNEDVPWLQRRALLPPRGKLRRRRASHRHADREHRSHTPAGHAMSPPPSVRSTT